MLKVEVIIILFFVININSSYKIAIVNYHPIPIKSNITPYEVQILNADEYIHLIDQAKRQEANIIVFPEYGLTGTGRVLNKTEINLDNYGFNVDRFIRANKTLCDEDIKNVPKPIVKLSCAAKTHEIYVIANILETVSKKAIDNDSNTDYGDIEYPDYEADYDNDDNKEPYSTFLIFDKNGNNMDRYRKIKTNINFHTHNGSADLKTIDIEGDKFALLISEDIFSAKLINEYIQIDKDVTFIHSASYASKAPFLTAQSIQSGISKKYNINLISSSIVEEGYRSGGGLCVNGKEEYISYVDGKSSLIVAEVDGDKKEIMHTDKDDESDGIHLIELEAENFDNYGDNFNAMPLTNDSGNEYICIKNNSSCCKINWKFENKSPEYTYMMIIYSGNNFMETNEPFTICGITACKYRDPKSCGCCYSWENAERKLTTFKSLSVSAELPPNPNSNNKDVLYFPSTLTTHFLPLKPESYGMNDEGTRIEIHLTEKTTTLLSFGIVVKGTHFTDFGRIGVDRSVKGSDSKAGAIVELNTVCLLVASIIIYYIGIS